MTTDNAGEKLYDFFLMGLAWLRLESPDRPSVRGASVFASLQYAKSGFELAQTLATQSWDLMELVKERGIVHEGSKNPSRQEIRRLVAESEKHNVVLAVPSAGMTPALFFGPNGYSHVITNAGLAYASSIMDRYATIITRDNFLRGWESHCARMTSYNATKTRPNGE